MDGDPDRPPHHLSLLAHRVRRTFRQPMLSSCTFIRFPSQGALFSVRLDYTTIFSTVNGRVLIFTICSQISSHVQFLMHSVYVRRKTNKNRADNLPSHCRKEGYRLCVLAAVFYDTVGLIRHLIPTERNERRERCKARQLQPLHQAATEYFPC